MPGLYHVSFELSNVRSRILYQFFALLGLTFGPEEIGGDEGGAAQQKEGQEISEQADGQGAADSAPGDEAAGQETFLTEADGIPKIIAHRGYSGQFPENTLAAFAGALDIGADYIELDVQLSKDGQVVILHDDSLKRTTGVDGKVSDFTYEELAGLDAGAWFDASFAGEKIPTLEEALTLIRDTQCGVYLELKDIGQVEGFEEAVLTG